MMLLPAGAAGGDDALSLKKDAKRSARQLLEQHVTYLRLVKFSKATENQGKLPLRRRHSGLLGLMPSSSPSASSERGTKI